MDAATKRFAEVRLLVVVTVEINHAEFVARVRDRRPTTVGQSVSEELVSNLKSLSYIGTVVTVEL